ncbi:MAG: PAS domain S-box protein, partial [Pontiellaceae bacterium]|nr:PAS domain S-box protein [Pontiellaceae bacterium]
MNSANPVEQLLELMEVSSRAEAQKLISELIERETERHRKTTRELNEARLAALNMMEDSMLAKKQLELTQFSIDHSADSAFWIRPDASFSYVNEAACNKLGWSQDELLHMAVRDIDPDFPSEIWPEHWQELKKGGGLTFETRHKTK